MRSETKKGIIDFLLPILVVLLLSIVYYIGYVNGQAKGIDKTVPIAVKSGWNAALDSVNLILDKQVKSDTNHCTYLCIDTTKYYLQHKKICY